MEHDNILRYVVIVACVLMARGVGRNHIVHMITDPYARVILESHHKPVVYFC